MKDAKLASVSITGAMSYVLFAFIAMAGLSYINYLPGVVNALAGGIGFTDVEAGEIVALNGYGGLVGSLVAIFLVRRIRWRPVMFVLLATLVAVDFGTGWVEDYTMMLVWRFFAGVVGGLCVGIAFATLAKLNNPDAAFGTVLFIQFSVGSLIIYLLPVLEQKINAYAVFYVMASLVLMSLIMLMYAPSLPEKALPQRQSSMLVGVSGRAILLLLAITCYQIAASAIWTYVGLIGHSADIVETKANLYIAITGLLGLLGAMLPVVSGHHFERKYMIIFGITLSMIAAILLNFSYYTPLYIGAMALLFFSWPAVQSYLLAITAEMDRTGRLSTMAVVVTSVGLATGPLFASSLLVDGEFTVMLYGCAIVFFVSFLFVISTNAEAKRLQS
ncbi:MFS transporter [Pseudoalteromonas sp. MMG012]|uniref:MFS transporter n=1 Tax=Pseudoalteromonas sp. MMG012 TaxID=2822686 RepID=UPI001B3A2C10|nr:MFS transporter [Pseudoalteromonas sp. MMG012]MBQ4852663.1 hypothetical protein [Pseudoalteromonas sp. MMG012]